MEDAAERLLHAESDLTYAKPVRGQLAALRNQLAFHPEQQRATYCERFP